VKLIAVVVCVVGAVLTSLAVVAPWGHVGTSPAPPLPASSIDIQGLDVTPGIRVLAIVAVAAVVTALALRRWARQLVGAVVLGCGIGIVVQALENRSELALTKNLLFTERTVVDTTLWPWAAALGGVLVCASGLVVLLAGSRWSGLSSAYQPPAAREPDTATPKGAWDAMDRGEDPTH
jgi:uncharacterized membrane protein (TIGR02234 family)